MYITDFSNTYRPAKLRNRVFHSSSLYPIFFPTFHCTDLLSHCHEWNSRLNIYQDSKLAECLLFGLVSLPALYQQFQKQIFGTSANKIRSSTKKRCESLGSFLDNLIGFYSPKVPAWLIKCTKLSLHDANIYGEI